MNYARHRFGLTAIEDRLNTAGRAGLSTSSQTSVESFSHETGWMIKDAMELPSPRNNHCSVALGTRLVVLGGSVPVLTNSVHAFDTSSQASWVSLASMNTARSGHACNTGDFEEVFGIYVAGGYNEGFLNTVEFYSPVTDFWINLDSGHPWHCP